MSTFTYVGRAFEEVYEMVARPYHAPEKGVASLRARISRPAV